MFVTDPGLQGIATTWASLGLDMAEYKATCKLRSTEEVFAALEDNMVTLSTMKASRFFAVFEKDITLWEKTLSLVSETIELVLTVGHSLPFLHHCNINSFASQHPDCEACSLLPVSTVSTRGSSVQENRLRSSVMLSPLLEAGPANALLLPAGATQLDVPGKHLHRLRRHSQAAATGICHV